MRCFTLSNLPLSTQSTSQSIQIIGKPTIIIKGSGGWANILAEEGLLRKFEVRPCVASSAREAVELALRMCEKVP